MTLTPIARIIAILIAMMTLVSSLSAVDWRARGDGGDRFAWILTPMEIPTGGVNGETVQRGQLCLFSAGKDLGSALIMRAHSVVEAPLFMSAHGDRLTFVYDTERSGAAANEDDAGRMRPVRSVRIFTTEAETFFVDPMDRYAIEPPLRFQGELLDAADSALGLAVLGRVDEEFALQVLGRDGWTERALPTGVAPPMRLLAHRDQLALIAASDGGAAIWTLGALDGAWSGSPIDARALEVDVFSSPGGLVGRSYDAETRRIEYELIRKDGVAPLATMDGVAPQHAVARLGENIVAAWMDEEAPTRMRAVIISSITGQTLYADFVNFGPPLTPADLRVVAFLLSAVMLGVLLFILKPETPAQAAPPKGWMVAEPSRRLFAAAIDGALACVGSALIWQAPIEETFDPSYLLLMSDGDSWPVLTAMGIYFVHGAIGEWLFERTAGKALLRIRTHSTRGARMKVWQSCARNLVKVIVPPLVALVLFEPNRRHPGDLLGGTIVIAPGSGEDDGAADAPGPDREE